ncbi:MAG TPA: octanoyltransferase [Phycisphaerales bacterium]|nr:octanoyltransferase [Phycisphaerales bacterium]
MEKQHLTLMDMGRMPYAQAWEQQVQFHQKVLDNELSGAILLVEHPPVITLSHRKTVPGNLLADAEKLTALGIDIQPTNRGGDITYHGPGQLVAYPILRLKTYDLTVSSYMRLLEELVIRTLQAFGITGSRESGKTGVWVQRTDEQQPTEKICAMGVRLKRGISLHGLALNVAPDMSHFDTIIPCGIADRSVTSLKQCLGDQCPTMQAVKDELVKQFHYTLDQHKQTQAAR